MASVAGLHNSRLQVVLFFLPIGLVLTLLFGGINLTLFESGFASRMLLYLGEKVLLAFHGRPPRLENLGFIYPPLAYFFVLIFRDPFWASALVGGLAATAFLWVVHQAHQKGRLSLPLFVVLILFACASPLSLFLLCQQLPSTLLITLLMLCYHYLYQYCRHQMTFALFIFGLLSPLLFFTQFQTILLIPFFVIPLLASAKRQSFGNIAAVVFTGFFPTFAMLAAWCYLNWLFMKDPLYFVAEWRSVLEPELLAEEIFVASQSLMRGLLFAVRLCVENKWLLIPYLTVMVRLFVPRRTRCPVSISIIAAPFLLLWFQIISGNLELSQHFFLLFPATALSVRMNAIEEEKKKGWFEKLFFLSLVVALLASFVYPVVHGSREEKLFTQRLFNLRKSGNLKDYEKLLAAIDRESFVLLDDTRLFPVVFLEGNPRRFLLPYEYEFETILRAPQFFARYLVISTDQSRDRLAGHFPLASLGYIPAYDFVGRFGELSLFQRSSDLPLAPENSMIHLEFP